MAPENLLQEALHAQRTGGLTHAEQLYRQLLDEEPGNFVALHHLGLVLIRRGMHAPGIDLVRKAIAQQPAYVEAYSNLGVALQEQGKYDEAVASFRRAIALRPQFAEAHANLGTALKRQGKLEDAISSFQRAIELKGDYLEALLSLAALFKEQGRLDEAIATLNRAIAANPEHPEPYFHLGVLLQKLSRLDDAIAAYRKAIAIRPDFTEFQFNLGVVLQQRGMLDEAIAAYRLAVAIKRDYPEVHCNLGNALRQKGKLDDAIAAYREAIALRPNFAEAQFNLGLAFQAQNRLDDAIAAYAKAVELKPDYLEAHSNLGNVLKDRGKLDDAIAAYRRAIAIEPSHAEPYLNLGIALQRQRKVADAIAAYRDAISRNPALAQAHLNLGIILKENGKLEEAIAAYREAISVKPNYPEAYSHLGIALGEQEKHDEAIAAYRQVIELNPSYADAYSNMGISLTKKGLTDDAIEAYRKAIKIRPSYGEAYSNLANALKEQGLIDEAIASYRQAIIRKPSYAGAFFNMSLLLLTKGEFDEGWEAYEWRLKGGTKDLRPRRLGRPQWQVEDLSNKTLLLHAEQGLGDALQFARFAPVFAARCGRLILEVHAPLLRLFRSLQGPAMVIAKGTPLPSYDFHLPLMSIPAALRLPEAAIPADVPYLRAEPERAAAWQGRLRQDGFKIGIAWQGRPGVAIDRGRSIPLSCFAPLARLPDVRLISLQKNHGLDQIEKLPEGFAVETLGADFDNGSDAFLDTAAVMEHLDLVITSDTAIAHLAGALGRPVWVVLRHMPDWRWQLVREDSPWYPTARLFRQRRAGDWDEVFERVARELERVVAGERDRLQPARREPLSGSLARVPSIPVPFGDLVDKITILEIKAERLRDAEKLCNVRRELDLLLTARQRCAPATVEIEELSRDLKRVNELLWEIEDEIRDCEARHEFGTRFTELARAVYKTNDQRSAIKRKINQVVGSALVEEKSYGRGPAAALKQSVG